MRAFNFARDSKNKYIHILNIFMPQNTIYGGQNDGKQGINYYWKNYLTSELSCTIPEPQSSVPWNQ